VNVTITLRDITRANWRECISLETTPEQRGFVASNAISLAQAAYETEWMPRAIYADEVMVGFVMYGLSREEPVFWIMRLMVDAQHQGKGYGRAAMEEVLRGLKRQPDCAQLAISYEPENGGARALYLSLGFRETGEVLYGETVARMPVSR
jgi:diamine N-acetyltransferase